MDPIPSSAFAIPRPFNDIRSGSAGRCLNELHRLIQSDPVVNEWYRTTAHECLNVKTDLKIRVTSTRRIRVRRFYWSLQRRTTCVDTNAETYCARTLILEQDSAPHWLTFPDDPCLPFAPGLLHGTGDWQVLQYVPLRRLTLLKTGIDGQLTVFKLKRQGRARDAASRLKHIDNAHSAVQTRYSLPLDLGRCRQSGALRQRFCPGHSLGHLLRLSASEALIEQLGSILASFHNVSVPTLPIIEPDNLSDLHDRVRQLRAFWPSAADRIGRCYEWLLHNKRPENELTLCHGDLSPENILLENDRWSLIDLDLAHLGDPVRDVAQLLVQLEVTAPCWSDTSFEFRAALLTGYYSVKPAQMPVASLHWHGCRAELEYLHVAFRKDLGNTRSHSASLVRAEEHCVGIGR